MKSITGLVIVLGSPNDEKGTISPIGQGRLLKGLEEYTARHCEGWKILLTGGFGEHFNTTARPHAYYAKRFLVERGIPESGIVEFAESRDTVDDALQSHKIVEMYGVDDLVVVSSDFHSVRVRYIFCKVFPQKNLVFSSSEYLEKCSEEVRDKLLAHEERELKSLRETGRSALFGIELNV